MSAEADPELLDLVSKNLEEEGYLYKMRAQLRAKIFQTLESQLNPQKIPTKTQLQDYLSSTEGQVVASLVKEFLDFYGLGYADGFFQPVASCGVDFFVSPREELEKQLGISDENGKIKKPLISHIVSKQSCVELRAANQTFTASNGDLSANNASMGSESNLQFAESQKNSLTVPEGKLLNGASSPENVLSAVQKLEITDRLSPGLTEPATMATMLKPPTASLLAAEQQKSLTETGSPADSLENYEEDFQSSVTLSPKDSKPAPASISEVEEVISEVVTNSESTVEELTLDASISLTSGFFGDHLQSV